MRPHAVIDCETDPFKPGRMPEPFLWGFYDGSEFTTYSETSDLAARVSEFDGRVYAHNGGRFDFHYLARFLAPTRIGVINGRLARARIGKAELRDSFLLFPVPLAAYGKSTIDYSTFEKARRDLPENRRAIRDYLLDDCRYLWELLAHYREHYPDSLTLAGAAMRLWRGMGGTVPKSTERFYERFRPFYYGGRVQAFTKGVHRGHYAIADIKSAYPFAMLHPHPIEPRNPNVRRRVPDARLGYCLVSVTANSDGTLPVRDERGGVTFPEGRVTTDCTGWEIIAGLETGTLHNLKIHKAIEFAAYTSFTQYVEHWYQKKLAAERAGDTAERLIAKLYMNALYGKFAADPSRYREWMLTEVDQCPDDWRAGGFFGAHQLASRPAPTYQHRYYNVATAASITGFVRAYLWMALQAASKPSYCDTDSIIAEDTSRLRFGDQLGDWEMECEPDKLAIAGKKLYAAWKDKQVLKARSKGVKLSAAEIERIARGEKIVYNPEVPTFSLALGNRFISREVKRT